VSNKIDDFTGEKVIFTSKEKITNETFTKSTQTLFMFRFENNIQFLHLFWQSRNIISVDQDAKILFKMSNGNLLTLYNTSYTLSEKGIASTALVKPAGIDGIELIYSGDDLKKMAIESVIKFRIFTNSGYVDFEVKEKDALNLKKLYKLFIQEIEK
jgi:hypothetical protein